jgi:hypothetical protein
MTGSMEARQFWIPYNERVRTRAPEGRKWRLPQLPSCFDLQIEEAHNELREDIANGKKLVEYRAPLTARAIRKAIEGN